MKFNVRTKITNVLLVSLLLLLTALPVFGQENYQLTEPVAYTLKQTIKIQNNSPVNVRLNLETPLMSPLTSPYQRLVASSVTPEPVAVRQVRDDRFGTFRLLLRPYEQQQIKLIYVIDTYAYNTEKENLATSGPGLTNPGSYLGDEKHIEASNPAIRSQALQLGTGLANVTEKTRAIFDFVNQYLTYNLNSPYVNQGALAALTNREGVCDEYASLFVALARANGIPARVVAGYRLDDKAGRYQVNGVYDATKLRHSWAEYYTPGYGWVPVEPTFTYTINGIKHLNWDFFNQIKNDDRHLITMYSFNNEMRWNYTYLATAKPDLKVWAEEEIREGAAMDSSKAGLPDSAVSIVINDQTINFQPAAQFVGGRIMVPMRTLFEYLGAMVAWDESSKKITAVRDQWQVELMVGQKEYWINKDARWSDGTPIMQAGQVLIPLRVAGEALGATVGWDPVAKVVSIRTN